MPSRPASPTPHNPAMACRRRSCRPPHVRSRSGAWPCRTTSPTWRSSWPATRPATSLDRRSMSMADSFSISAAACTPECGRCIGCEICDRPLRASDKAMTRFTAATILTALIIAMALVPTAAADLVSYVKTDDKAYRWEWTAHTDRVDGTTVHELTLISQVWHGITWQHRLRIIMPTSMQSMPPLALLIISGSGNGEPELREGGFMAHELGAAVAILH